MPHTRSKYIILSDKWISDMINQYKNSPLDIIFPKLLAHEQFHIFQRFNKDKLDILYSKYWNL